MLYKIFLIGAYISMALSLLLATIALALEMNKKEYKFLIFISFIFMILFAIFGEITRDINKDVLIESYQIYRVQEHYSKFFSDVETTFIVDTSNGRYELKEDVKYMLNGGKTLDVYQRYCRLGAMRGKYRYVIND